MKIVAVFLLTWILVCGTGCETFSTASYKASKREIQGERVIASGDQEAIKAWKSGNTIGIGVDVLASEALMKHPVRQAAAAVADAAVLYGIKEGLEYLVEINSSSSRDISVNISGDGNNTIDIASDNDTSSSSSTTTSSSTSTSTSTEDSPTDNSVDYADPNP